MDGNRKTYRRWFRFSLRTLLLLVTLCSVGFAWFGLKVHRSREQRAAVEALEKIGAVVRYGYDPQYRDGSLSGTPWLRAYLGRRLLHNCRIRVLQALGAVWN